MANERLSRDHDPVQGGRAPGLCWEENFKKRSRRSSPTLAWLKIEIAGSAHHLQFDRSTGQRNDSLLVPTGMAQWYS